MPKKTIKDYVKISIHALVKRATCACVIIKVNSIYFNPRPREEGDMYTGYIGTTPNGISIHALVKRATNNTQNRQRGILFQSTPS